jgi:tetratricopeptide (TPR) repeat protein
MKPGQLLLLITVMVLLSACIAPVQAPPSDHANHVMPEQLGAVDFPVSCTPEAQAEFNHGVALLHSFVFGPAIQSFTKVTELDPTCGMGHWGVAMSQLGIPWSPTPEQALVDGWAAVEKAAAAGVQTPREQAFIAAITAFFQDADTLDFRTRALAYEAAMAQLAQDYPDDTEAQIFYALALNITAPPTDKSFANQRKAVAILEPILQQQPNHPGVTHYLIHSNDYPALAAEGLDAALRYAGIAPAAPHALHMPSHIFTRLGYWQESIESNRASAEAVKAALSASYAPNTGFVDALHAMDYMMYGYLQLAQDEAAKALLDEIAAIEQVDAQNLGSAYALAAMPARHVLERGQWSEAATLALHPSLTWDRFPQAEATLVFAQGLGAARAGDVAAAHQALERLETLRETMVATNQGYWADQASIQIEEVAAWIALAEGEEQVALARMRQAATLEDATEKHPVTPGPIMPAHELLGEMLLELNQPEAALEEFEISQQIEPNRFRGLYGAARAAELAGEMEKARSYYEQLVALGAQADGERPEMADAQTFLAQ